jgi:hypothetical protein
MVLPIVAPAINGLAGNFTRWSSPGVGAAAAYPTKGYQEITLYIDLNGLKDGNFATDFLGVDGGSGNFGQFTPAAMGTVVAWSIACLQEPTGGSNTIAFVSTTAAPMHSGSSVGATPLLAATVWTAGGGADILTAPPANEYLGLASAGAGSAPYTAGKFLVKFYCLR